MISTRLSVSLNEKHLYNDLKLYIERTFDIMNSISTYIEEETLNMYYDRLDDIVESALDELNDFNGIINEDVEDIKAAIKEKAGKLSEIFGKFVEVVGNIIETLKGKIGAIKTKAENYLKAGKVNSQDDFSFLDYNVCEKNANTCKDTLTKIKSEMLDPLGSNQEPKNEVSAYDTVYNEIKNIGALKAEDSKYLINVKKGENLSTHLRAAISKSDQAHKEMGLFKNVVKDSKSGIDNIGSLANKENASNNVKALYGALERCIKFAKLGVKYCTEEIRTFDTLLKNLNPKANNEEEPKRIEAKA